VSSRGEWRVSWSDGGHKLDARLHGAVTFTDDLTDVRTLSDGGSFTLRDLSTGVPHTVEITAANGTLTHTYFVMGLKRAWDDEAKRFLATQLPILVRQTGIGAESRVKAIYGNKGVAGVLAEIDLLGGDYARRLYLAALLDLATFDSTTVQPVLQRVGQAMKSDYDRRQVLEHVASRVTLDQKGVAAYVQAMATMKSDYDQREALSALTRRSATAADGETLLPALAHIRSSYDKRVALEQILARGPMSTEGKRTILTAAAGIQSDYDRRQVLTAYLKRFGVEPPLRDDFFAAVRAIKSDYDAAEVLLAAVGPGLDSGSRPAFVLAAERIKSSHDQNRVLAALVKAERR
jgi:bla regulator protein blaR1